MSRLKRTAFETEVRTYTVEAYSHQLDEFEKMLNTIVFLGAIGASRNINLFVDGDGAARFKIQRVDSKENNKLIKDENLNYHEKITYVLE